MSMGVVQCCNLFLGQKLSNYCCRILNTVFVSSNLLLKSVEPQFSGCRVYLLLTEMSLFDLFDHFVDGGNVVIGSTCCGPTTVHHSLTLYPLETICATQKLLFDLMLHHHKPSESVPQSL